MIGALAAAREIGLERIITFDMGGTSTDVSLCDGVPTMSDLATLDGLPLLVPMLDIHTVGAGGGSIAFRDEGGALRVGPRSAGAMPGPASYGRGGEEPTVTDAHVVLGRLPTDGFLGGDLDLDAEAAMGAMERLSGTLDVSIERAAHGVLSVADAAMVRAIKVISLERGHDPGAFTLVVFGGAGGLHGCRLAQELGIEEVMIPRYPGLLSAWGMLTARSASYASQTMIAPIEALSSDLLFESVRETMERCKKDAPKAPEDVSWRGAVELRYRGQSFGIDVEVEWPNRLDAWREWEMPRERFESIHEGLYGWSGEEGDAIEMVTLRVEMSWGRGPEERARGEEALASSPRALSSGRVEREALDEGDVIIGPCVITEYSATTIIEKGWVGRVSRGHLVLRKEEG